MILPRQFRKVTILTLAGWFSLAAGQTDIPSEPVLLRHRASPDVKLARIRIDLNSRSPHKVNPLLFGKFTEHLGQNIYNGIDAQILMNPTFGRWRFSAGDGLVDGGFREESDPEKVAQQIRNLGRRAYGSDGEDMLQSYRDGAALFWLRLGSSEEVRLSPEAAQHGGRAQRIEIIRAPPGERRGLFQRTYLPLHRTRRFQYRLVARAVAPTAVRLAFASLDSGGSPGREMTSSEARLNRDWSTVTGELQVPAGTPARDDELLALTFTAEAPAHVVVSRILLYPADHVHWFDPDVIRHYREAGLPLMRWPGGNFVSGYRWRDGVGAVDRRPTVANPAWGGLEYNLFGTDEFIALCRAIGCRPLICVNAGDGTPEEAAAWVEYCNGSKETSMGRLRATNGHPEPYGVRYWEIGNEIYGRWQIGWTTPAGNADRFRRFAEAMLAVDPSIELIGCGHRASRAGAWNRQLLDETRGGMRIIADHILTGGTVNPQTDPDELFHAFMGFARQLGAEYRDLRRQMLAVGIHNPRLAITELQLFARFAGSSSGPQGPLSPETMPTPRTISEALYDATIIHECIRLGDFVEMLTHSATVNHGGGLEKRRERVWAHPCHYGNAMMRVLAGGTPLAVEMESGTYATLHAFGEIAPMKDVPVLDPLAVLGPDASLLSLMVVHRGSGIGPVALLVDPGQFPAHAEAEVVTLAGDSTHDRNSLEEPERVRPRKSSLTLRPDGTAAVTLPPYSLTRIIFTKAQSEPRPRPE